jgi:hypothetical protein
MAQGKTGGIGFHGEGAPDGSSGGIIAFAVLTHFDLNDARTREGERIPLQHGRP